MDRLSDFGFAIKIKLLQKNKKQAWLIDKLRNETGMYVDSSLMHKISVGKYPKSKLIPAIKKILSM